MIQNFQFCVKKQTISLVTASTEGNMTAQSFWVLAIVCFFVTQIEGHGRLYDPPSRSTMWRMGYKTPKNYNDNQLFCGGYSYQQGQGGKCGICGDPYGMKRENEAGGKYATGIITKKYTKGQTITIDVEVTANHNGWFEFRICPNNNVKKPATKQCLDRHILELADGTGTRYHLPNTNVGHFKSQWKLPDDVVCTQCVLQWKWHVANSWGRNPDGRSCIGCGAQEEFYGCADVEIVDNKPAIGILPLNPVIVVNSATTPTPLPTTTTTPKPTTTTTTPKPTTTTTTPQPTTTTATPQPTTTTTTPKPTTTTTTPKPTMTLKPVVQNNQSTIKSTAMSFQTFQQKCGAVGIWKTVKGMKSWCVTNCAAGYCPATHCSCR